LGKNISYEADMVHRFELKLDIIKGVEGVIRDYRVSKI
jgi:hypothetical protein